MSQETFTAMTRKLRKQKKLTQVDVANALKVSQSWVCKYEQNKIEPVIGEFLRLCEILELPLSIAVGEWNRG